VFNDGLKCVAWAAQYIIIGFAGGGIPRVPANILLVKNTTLHGVFWGAYMQYQPAVVEQGMQQVGGGRAEGSCQCVPAAGGRLHVGLLHAVVTEAAIVMISSGRGGAAPQLGLQGRRMLQDRWALSAACGTGPAGSNRARGARAGCMATLMKQVLQAEARHQHHQHQHQLTPAALPPAPQVLQWISERRLQVEVSHRYDLVDVREAFSALLQRKVMGKMLLLVDPQAAPASRM
jgi:NADPH:quinone reductase-like Zn-dependent oxidoreductase